MPRWHHDHGPGRGQLVGHSLHDLRASILRLRYRLWHRRRRRLRRVPCGHLDGRRGRQLGRVGMHNLRAGLRRRGRDEPGNAVRRRLRALRCGHLCGRHRWRGLLRALPDRDLLVGRRRRALHTLPHRRYHRGPAVRKHLGRGLHAVRRGLLRHLEPGHCGRVVLAMPRGQLLNAGRGHLLAVRCRQLRRLRRFGGMHALSRRHYDCAPRADDRRRVRGRRGGLLRRSRRRRHARRRRVDLPCRVLFGSGRLELLRVPAGHCDRWRAARWRLHARVLRVRAGLLGRRLERWHGARNRLLTLPKRPHDHRQRRREHVGRRVHGLPGGLLRLRRKLRSGTDRLVCAHRRLNRDHPVPRRHVRLVARLRGLHAVRERCDDDRSCSGQHVRLRVRDVRAGLLRRRERARDRSGRRLRALPARHHDRGPRGREHIGRGVLRVRSWASTSSKQSTRTAPTTPNSPSTFNPPSTPRAATMAL